MLKKRSTHKISKNVTITLESLDAIIGYQNKTKRNFSQTLDIIIKEWDEFSIAIQKLKTDEHMKNIEKATVIKK